MKWIKRFILLLLALVLLTAGALAVLPWKSWVESKLVAAIEAQGITPVALTLDHIGGQGLVLKDIRLGEPPLILARATVGYDIPALLRGQVGSITLDGMKLAATQGESGWQIEGLAALMDGGGSARASIPLTHAAILSTPLPALSLVQSEASITAKGWSATIPIALKLSPLLDVALDSNGLEVSTGEQKISIEALHAEAALGEGKAWRGRWTIAGLTTHSETLVIPPLAGGGEITATATRITLNGTLADAKKTHRLRFTLAYALDTPEGSTLAIEEAAMPWGGGRVALNRVTVPLAGDKPTKFTVSVQQVELATLMKALTGDTATATGVVSGEVPVTYTAGGKITLGNGALKADAPGIITLSPEAIPGDNPQVGLVRDVMKNLHYSVLSLELGMGENGALNASLKVEGNNPDIEAGRPIKLRVNLSGDLLDLFLQNMKLMTDPTKFIDESTHETSSD